MADWVALAVVAQPLHLLVGVALAVVAQPLRLLAELPSFAAVDVVTQANGLAIQQLLDIGAPAPDHAATALAAQMSKKRQAP